MTVSNPDVIETINGQVQVSCRDGSASIGLLVERDGIFGGTLLSRAQAEQLANALLKKTAKSRRFAERSVAGSMGPKDLNTLYRKLLDAFRLPESVLVDEQNAGRKGPEAGSP
jgi:hypothetical protein